MDTVDETPMLPTTQGLLWFGQAIRGSWGDIDGRSIQGGIETYAAYIDVNPKWMPEDSVRAATHDTFGICLYTSEFDEGVFAIWSGDLWKDHTCLVCGKTGSY